VQHNEAVLQMAASTALLAINSSTKEVSQMLPLVTSDAQLSLDTLLIYSQSALFYNSSMQRHANTNWTYAHTA
jgi:hypothetical protein